MVDIDSFHPILYQYRGIGNGQIDTLLTMALLGEASPIPTGVSLQVRQFRKNSSSFCDTIMVCITIPNPTILVEDLR
jgi:hypothetical protein